MKYTSKYRDPRYIIRPTDRVIDEQRRVHVVPGLKAEFINHLFWTENPELIEALHNHPLRGIEFDEILEKDEKVIEATVKAVPMTAGGRSTANIAEAKVDEYIEVSTRSTDVVAVSPELIKLIDERISSAMGEVISLLKKQEKKENQVTGKEKGMKTYKCPYCGDTNFNSPFKLGTHKNECTKKP